MFPPTPQSQMETLQPQVELSQQIDVECRSNLTLTSADHILSSVNNAPITSQNAISICSVTPKPTTLHTPMTTVQYHSYNQQQELLCDNAADESSTSSQVATYI